jgi:hypothetical protein
MKIALWLAGNLIFWAGLPFGGVALVRAEDNEALRLGKISYRELAAHDSYGILLYGLFGFSTLVILIANVIMVSLRLSRRARP